MIERPADGVAPKPPADSAPAAAGRIRAVSAYLLDREPLLPLLASRLGASDAVFETEIRGSSMSPAIPARARIRVQLRAESRCRLGEVVFYLSDGGFMVHRVAHLPQRGRAASWMLTFGDHCLVPDPPVRQDRVLGTVIAVEAAGGWRAPGASPTPALRHRLIRALALAATLGALWFSVPTARRLALLLQRFESAGRAPAGRLLRWLHRTSSGH